MAPKTKAKAKATPEPEPVEVEPPEVMEEALEAAKQLKLEEKIAMRAAREAEVAEQTAKMNFEAKVNETVEEGRRIEAEIQEAKDLGLSPFKAVRMRRKSKDLETSATDLLGAALDKIFLECNCEPKTWPPPRIAFRDGPAPPHSIRGGWPGLHVPKAHGNSSVDWRGQLPRGPATGQGFCRGAFTTANVVTYRSDLNEEGQLPTTALQALAPRA